MRGHLWHHVVIAPSMTGKTTFLCKAERPTRRRFVAEDCLDGHELRALYQLRPPSPKGDWHSYNDLYVTLLLEKAGARFLADREPLTILVHHQDHARALRLPTLATVVPPLATMESRWRAVGHQDPNRVLRSRANWKDVYSYTLLSSTPSVESLDQLLPN